MLGYLGVVTLESSRGQTWSLARALDFNFGVFVATHSVGRQGPSRRGGGHSAGSSLVPAPLTLSSFWLALWLQGMATKQGKEALVALRSR